MLDVLGKPRWFLDADGNAKWLLMVTAYRQKAVKDWYVPVVAC